MRNTSKRSALVTLAAGAILAASLGCSTTVRGVIRDKPTGNPLASATVQVGESTATTNGFGAYVLDARVKPSSLLIINAPGYFMYSASVAKRNDEGGDLIRDVELAPRSEMTTRK